MTLRQRDGGWIHLRSIDVEVRIVRKVSDEPVEQGFRALEIVGKRRSDLEAAARGANDAVSREVAVAQNAEGRALRLANPRREEIRAIGGKHRLVVRIYLVESDRGQRHGSSTGRSPRSARSPVSDLPVSK